MGVGGCNGNDIPKHMETCRPLAQLRRYFGLAVVISSCLSVYLSESVARDLYVVNERSVVGGS